MAGDAGGGVRRSRRAPALSGRGRPAGLAVPAVRPRQRGRWVVSAGRDADGGARRRAQPRRPPDARPRRQRSGAAAPPGSGARRGHRRASPVLVQPRLELLSEQYLADVAAMFGDEDVLRYTRVPVPVPTGWEREWLDFYEAGRRDGTREA